jgi:hypothetical protein
MGPRADLDAVVNRNIPRRIVNNYEVNFIIWNHYLGNEKLKFEEYVK